ncbi:MAG: transketolase [Alphaproteobacteria bacterium]
MTKAAKRAEQEFTSLDEIAARLAPRARRIRQLSIASIFHAGSGHPGGSLSAADMLAALYGAELRVSPASFAARAPDNSRDRFILSKGHAAPALYATGAEFGFVTPAALKNLRRYGSPLQGHPHVADTPFAETSTGSLGQGFSVAIGAALGLRHQGLAARSYAMLGDGEMQEGEVWEGAMCAAHHRLDNLCALVDYNKLQSDDLNSRIMGLEPLGEKWRAFGWHVIEINGHEIKQIIAALTEAGNTKDKPSVIIAHTIKGKGVSFMENGPLWHGSVKLSEDDTRRALSDLGLDRGEIDRWIHGDIR